MNNKNLSVDLQTWFHQFKRELPFRKNKDPYRIWISEVMLQQTRVNSMLDHYRAFLSEFPTLADLASGKEEKVLSLWKGLGYYNRDKNLHRGAKYIMENFNGLFPSDSKELQKVPGIGPYTSNAILSIAFSLPYAVLDGNVKRVLSILFAFSGEIDSSSNEKILQGYADELLDTKFPGNHNEAIMELGASICRPKDPDCTICPISTYCIAFQKKRVGEFPKTKLPIEKIPLKFHFYLIFNESSEVLIYEDPEKRFFPKFKTPPFLISGENLSKSYTSLNHEMSELINHLPEAKEIYAGKHSITKHSIHLFFSIHKVKEKDIKKMLNIEFITLNSLPNRFPSSIVSKILKNPFLKSYNFKF